MLESEAVDVRLRGYYRKWLRFYLDFCRKYGVYPAHKNSIPAFNDKLREKAQPEQLRCQAHHAISRYHRVRWEFSVTSEFVKQNEDDEELLPGSNHSRTSRSGAGQFDAALGLNEKERSSSPASIVNPLESVGQGSHVDGHPGFEANRESRVCSVPSIREQQETYTGQGAS